MSDDQGWGDVGYRRDRLCQSQFGRQQTMDTLADEDNETLWKCQDWQTPGFRDMAANGLRLERFYTSPICSPTRAAMLTGRAAVRTGVVDQGVAMRLQERTIALALREAGFSTAHFGKWHLDGLHIGVGGAPMCDNDFDPHAFGFDYYLSNSGQFEINPVLSRNGTVATPLWGDGSDVLVSEALRFIGDAVAAQRRFFVAVWYSSPHAPWIPLSSDRNSFRCAKSTYYGEIQGVERSIGTMRQGLRRLGIENDTLVWFNSDNGGDDPKTSPRIPRDTSFGLTGHKKSLNEGGIRVPAIIEWPGHIVPRISWRPACAYDLFPTIAEVVGLPQAAMLQPQDGLSLVSEFGWHSGDRTKPIAIQYKGSYAIIDNDWKLLRGSDGSFRYFDLRADPKENYNISDRRRWSDRRRGQTHNYTGTSGTYFSDVEWMDVPTRERRARVLRSYWHTFFRSANASNHGLDYGAPTRTRMGPGWAGNDWYTLKCHRCCLQSVIRRLQWPVDEDIKLFLNRTNWPVIDAGALMMSFGGRRHPTTCLAMPETPRECIVVGRRGRNSLVVRPGNMTRSVSPGNMTSLPQTDGEDDSEGGRGADEESASSPGDD